jgi:hypothetical protein
MKKLIIYLSVLFALTRADAASIYEPFADARAYGGTAYNVGSLLCSGFTAGVDLVESTNATGGSWGCISNFAGAAVSGNPIITNGNLSYPGLPSSSGNSLYIPPATGNMGRMSLAFPAVSTGQCYYSFLLKVTDISTLTATATPNVIAAFGDNVGPQRAAVARAQSYLVAQKSGGGYILGIGKNKPSVANTFYDTTVRNVGDVLFVVASYDYSTTGHPASLWINPAANSFGASTPPTATGSITTGTELNSPGIQSFMLGCFTNAPPGCIVDDVRVGLTWAVVTGAPDIEKGGATVATNAGLTVTIPSFVVGQTPFTYQWYNGVNALSDGGNVSGSATATLTLANVTQNDSGAYALAVSNPYGSTSGTVATLNVSDPAINSQPSSETVAPGVTTTFSVSAGGVAPLSYRWNKDGTDLNNGGNISGADTATLSVQNVSFSDQGSYSVFVQNGNAAGVQSAVATLTVNDPAITSQPQSVTANYATTATFQVTTVGLTARSYQWKRVDTGNVSDGGRISGAHTSALTITGVSYLDAASYYVTVTDTASSVDSANATLTVIEPIITSQPSSTSTIAGTAATFNVSATGVAPLNYQWRKNGGNLVEGGNISGSTTSSLTVSSTGGGDAGNYSVVVGDVSGQTVTSSDAALNVLLPPSISSQPSSRVIVAGNNAAFAVVASGTAPFSYQWLSNGLPIANATAFAYTLSNVQAPMSASYSVVVTNTYGSTTSSAATLTVVPSVRLFSTNLIVVRVGDGAETPTFNGNSVFLDQVTTNGAYVNTVSIPNTGANALIEMGPDANGSTITGTALSRSQNRSYMVLSGYHTTAPYTTTLFNTSSTAVPRGVGLIDGNGQFTLPVTDTTAYSGTYFRGAASDGTNNFWGAGNAGGTYYFGLSQPALTVQSTFPNLRSVDVVNGNLFTVSGSSSGIAVLQWNGLPTTATTPTTLFIPGSTPTDMAVDPTGTIIYLGTSIGVMRYQFDGSQWNFAYTLVVGAVRYITVDFSGAMPIVYATTSDSTYNRLLAIVDNSGQANVTTLLTAGVNQNLRGVRFGPDSAAAPAIISVSRNASNVILNWDPPYSLQSSTDVAGTFTNVPGATSPYTIDLSTSRKAFFKVK